MKAHSPKVKQHTTYPWRGRMLKLTQIARQENVDAMELRRRVVTLGCDLFTSVAMLQVEGRTFHERAASHGATGITRTGTKRTRWTKQVQPPKKHFV